MVLVVALNNNSGVAIFSRRFLKARTRTSRSGCANFSTSWARRVKGWVWVWVLVVLVLLVGEGGEEEEGKEVVWWWLGW
jgi:hypothetical protein